MVQRARILTSVIARKTPWSMWADWRSEIHNRRAINRWGNAGKPIPPPHAVKVQTVKDYSARYSASVLIETGTFLGDMVFAVKHLFDEIISIELDNRLYARAKERFRHYPHISILQGDSGELLPRVLANINERSLFWLDAHYSGEMTARGDRETPIEAELRHILSNHSTESTILIDDARLFTGERDYPNLEELEVFVLRSRPTWVFEVRDDIIRMHKRD